MYASVRASKADNENFTRQGSLRKVLPPEHNKENLFGRQNEDLNKIYKNYRQEYVILAEYKMIHTENIPGVYVIPSKESPFLWFGIIFVRSGLYEDGVFRFSIVLDENFPDSEHPKVIFQSEIFHPVINPESNELHLLEAFPTWNKSEQHIWQILKYIQWIFYNTEASLPHAVNKEALEMFKSNQEAFKNKINELVKLSQDHLYDEPPTEDAHYLTFEPYDPIVHDKVRTIMVNPPSEEPVSKTGHSWVLPGSFQPLGRPPSPDSEGES